MGFRGQLRRRSLAAAVATAVVAQLAIFGGEALAGETPLWQKEVGKIPTADYTRDAKLYIAESCEALSPYVAGGLGDSRLAPVLADVQSRYFDGARLKSAADGTAVFDHLKPLESFLKSRLTGASPPNGEAEQAHVRALVETLTGARLLADAAIQDAEATIGPFRASPPPAPAPVGLTEAFADLAAARTSLAKADEMLVKANPEPATIQLTRSWASAFNVLTRLGITYGGDHDSDGVIDVVELRFGSSPLLVDSDGDRLTDKFEITRLAGWTRPNTADTDSDAVADGAEDVDSDGLTNLQEQDLGTSPTEADTDGDGVNDGAEVAKGSNPLVADQPRAPPAPGTVPPIVPVPNEADTDGDGLIDVAEEEVLSDVNNVDSDGDGLSDGVEVNDWGINPLVQDTDGDGLRDDYEVAHKDDQGLDPGRPDEQISKWTYVSDFLLGMFAGDFAPRDSIAWLSGNLCSGALSFIPVVGWIVGGLADIRDTIAGLIHGDWVGAGLSILGVVPYVGDAVAIPGKAARFVVRFAHRAEQVVLLVATYDSIPDSVKEAALEQILGEDWTALQDAGLAAASAGDGFDALAARAGMLRLARGARTNFARLRAAYQHPLHVKGPRVRYMYNWQDGESYVLNNLLTGVRHQNLKVLTPQFPTPRSVSRKPDIAVEDPPGELTLHEVKTGVPNYGGEVAECEKDAWTLRQASVDVVDANKQTTKYKVRGIQWHFLPHNAYHTLGPTQEVLDCLIRNNIPYTIHFPE
ncbi:hypothetical protein ACFYO8_05885 [Micromonospora sp. NPDC005257]|uniref:hypothetical protein n=1 Tax=unclassified Micromonospora TaxID=2617518 RepID=UPI0036B4D33E